MRVVEFIRLVARSRSETEGRSSTGWKRACDYIAREVILEQPSHVTCHLEELYRAICERADSNARVFTKKKRKRNEHICKVAGCDQAAAQTSHFCDEHRHTVEEPTA